MLALLAGCGHGAKAHHAASAPPTPCLPAARDVLAERLGVSTGAIAATPGTANSGNPQCLFAARRLRVTVIVDSGPQPYFRLERAIVEDSQVFSTVRLEPAPQHISGLGLDASWFPGEQQLMTSDGQRLITVGVMWRGVREGSRRSVATAVARLYLRPGRLRGPSGYPSGG